MPHMQSPHSCASTGAAHMGALARGNRLGLSQLISIFDARLTLTTAFPRMRHLPAATTKLPRAEPRAPASARSQPIPLLHP